MMHRVLSLFIFLPTMPRPAPLLVLDLISDVLEGPWPRASPLFVVADDGKRKERKRTEAARRDVAQRPRKLWRAGDPITLTGRILAFDNTTAGFAIGRTVVPWSGSTSESCLGIRNHGT